MNERLKQVIEYYGLSVRAFEQKISVTEGLIYKALTRNSDLGATTISKILDNCDDISPDWLLLGKGQMLRSQSTPQPSHDDFFVQLLAEKDKKIEALVRENERLLLQLQQLKEKAASSSEETALV